MVGRVLIVVALVLTACSGGGSSSATDAPTSTTVPPGTLPLVDEIDDAVFALETQLGAKQQFFEINATSSLVNLIVALNDGKVAQPWVYLDGQLSSTEGAPASGSTFDSSALDFDPDKVLSKIETELPQSSIDLFFIEGGKENTVQYTAAVTSSQGGQLLVVVGPDGTVQSVDAS
ncbi:MAG TPA: hypothetical protein VHQ23_19095 [Ilumatobacteraceae bacterium]|nr:hypothetical protein [Ilumatobacteraceae bacterium]